MASSRFSPPRRPPQHLSAASLKGQDRLAVPKFHIADPLLGSLSPESTLKALSSTNALPSNEQATHDILTRSISQASPSERALGIRAAVVAQKLGQWYREVQTWTWPKRTDAHLGKGFIPPSDANDTGYCGSLPAAVVEEYRKRIEEIKDGMDALDMEELKEHILNAHIPGRSRPSSANSTMSVPPPLSYVQLSDFTAVITTLILRSLPLLSRLNSLLSTWTVRLLVLRQIPGLLQSLRLARSEMNSALNLLKSPDIPTEKDALYSISNYHAKRASLESMLISAGRRMDHILDSLDGREDFLPESWIDDLESTEADFATWVMEAEKRAVENEWRRLAPRSRENVKPAPGLAKPEMATFGNVQKPNVNTPDNLPRTSSSTENIDLSETIVAPEPEPLSRFAALQTGRGQPMETIVEEIGSPFEPPTSQAVDKTNISATEARDMPESPSPLPSGPADLPEAQRLIPVIQLEASPETTDCAASLPGSPQSDLRIDGNASKTPVNVRPVAERSDFPKESDSSISSVDSSTGNTSSRPEENSSQQPTAICTVNNSVAMVPMVDTQPIAVPAVDSLPVDSIQQGGKLTGNCVAEDHTPQLKPDSGYDTVVAAPVAAESTRPEPARRGSGPADVCSGSKSKSFGDLNRAYTSDTNIAVIPSTGLVQQHGKVASRVAQEDAPPSTRASIRGNDVQAEPMRSSTAAVTGLRSENDSTIPAATQSCAASKGFVPIVEADNRPSPTSVVGDKDTPASDTIQVTAAKKYTPSPKRCSTPPNDSASSFPNLFISFDTSKAPAEQRQPEGLEQQGERDTPRKPLDSPIKLSKFRPGSMDIDRHSPNSRSRRPSDASDDSLSDFPSLVSSPEMREPRTTSANGTPVLFETPPHFPTDFRGSGSALQANGHALQESRLLHFDAQKPSPGEPFKHKRTLSIPLQRFINESLDLNYEPASGPDEDAFTTEAPKYGKRERAVGRPKSQSVSSPGDVQPRAQHLATPRGEASGADSDGSSKARRQATGVQKKSARTTLRAVPLDSTGTKTLKKRLTAHPSLENIGPYKSSVGHARGPPAKRILENTKSRPFSSRNQLIKPKDQMDVKINSILTSLPGSIHLVPADQDDDAVSVASSAPFKRERFRSNSPQDTPSRGSPTTPSFTLRPAGRRRHSHAPEEASVKLYHLHRVGRSAPTKLFVRTVGQNERVMVRVGGGWADLAEYLREYALHHGGRHVSDAPLVEIEGLSPRESPSCSPPSPPPSRMSSGSRRPSLARPPSAISSRPSSSLTVRKVRRSSNVSDKADFRSVSAGNPPNVAYFPTPRAVSGRRMSVSSNVSTSAVSSISEVRHASPGTTSQTVPLGLAGPKPRAIHATITPESEAWVEDVLGQARRGSVKPPKPENESDSTATPVLSKSRSISDIGKAGTSKRVFLRGLR
ncbi:hypothetical protein BJX61DRAFT_62646 [Aspergillus egyptiacus]|nr:hypothetical protein BJX61DRAFT_62646 [Aspergillus egyptiacus]